MACFPCGHSSKGEVWDKAKVVGLDVSDSGVWSGSEECQAVGAAALLLPGKVGLSAFL